MSNKTEKMKKENKRTLTPKLRFPEFRNAPEWDQRPLGELTDPVTERVGDLDCVPYTVTSGEGLISQEEKYGRTIAGNSLPNYIRLKKGDFAYNKSGTKAYPEGYISRYLDEVKGAVPNSIFTCFRVASEEIIPKYLDLLFLGNHHGRWLRRFLTIGARAHGSLNVTDGDLWALPVATPSPSEQRKIADCFSSLDGLIVAEGQKLEALRDHKQGLMQQLFPPPGQTQPRLRFPEFRSKPGWKQKALKQIAHYENGKAYEKSIVDNGRYTVVNSRFISTDGEVRKHSNETFCIAKNGDVLMVLSDLPKGRALAKCFLVREDNAYAVNQRVCKLEPFGVVSAFLCYALNRHPNLMIFDDGMTQTHLSKADVCDCMLSIPIDNKEQKQIAECLSALDTQVAAQAAKVDTLKLHKRGLMQQLFPTQEEH